MNPIRFLRTHVWGEIPIEVTPRSRRWAALLWGGALVALGVLAAMQAQRQGLAAGAKPWIFGIAGVALAAALLMDAIGPSIYRGVLMLFAVFGWVLSQVLLVLFFYLCLTPMGWLLRLSGKDFLATGPRARPAWRPHAGPPERKRYFRLF